MRSQMLGSILHPRQYLVACDLRVLRTGICAGKSNLLS